MSNLEIIRTENVLVRIMELAAGASTGWHHHTDVNDYFVCLTGVVKVEAKTLDEEVILLPGQRAEIKAPRIHRVVNVNSDTSEYLLVQGVGTYDFIKETR
jgi:quercetin dioxygenase-like cupin family protein